MSSEGKRSILNLYGGVGYDKHYYNKVTDDAVNAVGHDSKYKFKFHQVDFKNAGGDYEGDVVDVVKTIHDMQSQDVTATSERVRIEGKFDTEVSDLKSKDSQLQTDLDQEVQDRKDGDTAIQADLDAYKVSETDARQNADNVLTTKINEEATERKNADDNEAVERKAADEQLQLNIDDEASQRAAAISAEASARMNKDNLFAAELATFKGENANEHSVLQGNIDAEVSSRIAADNTLQSNLDDEEQKRINGDASLQTNIDNEVTDRKAADTVLQNNIDSEAVTRENSDTVLQSNIDTEAATRSNADTVLQSNIDSEAATRGNADTLLQSNIDAEAATRGEADTKLQDNLNTVESNMDAKISAVDARVDAILAGSDVQLDTLKEIVDNYNQLNTDALSQVGNNRTDIDYLLKVVGTLLKINDGTSGHPSQNGVPFQEWNEEFPDFAIRSLEESVIVENYSNITKLNFSGDSSSSYSNYFGDYDIYTGYGIDDNKLIKNDGHYYVNKLTNSGFFRENKNGLWKFITNLTEPYTNIITDNPKLLFGIFGNKDDIKVPINKSKFGNLIDIS